MQFCKIDPWPRVLGGRSSRFSPGRGSLGLLPGSLLFHGDSESEGELGIVVGVNAELEAASSGDGAGAVFALGPM
jgi:hypothetical protein